NHEDMFLSYLGLPGQHGDMFLVNGGKVTLESYGLSTNRDPKELLAQIPSQHVDFYQNLINYYIAEPFLCVHAGVHPLKSLEEQTESEMFWIRNQFIYRSHMLPYVILFGHTPQSDVFYDLPYKIGLDTGLVYGNKLTCLEIEQKVLYQIHRGKKQIKKIPIQKKWDAMSGAITPCTFSHPGIPCILAWRCSSVGQSTRLISAESTVRVCPPPPKSPVFASLFTSSSNS